MKILFIGDIFGKPGKKIAANVIPKLIREKKVDFCIANGENAAGGFGLTFNSAKKLFSYGIDTITSGNHIWDRQEAESLLDESNNILRPANYPPGAPGIGYTIIKKDDFVIGIINLIGRIFMQPYDCPFRKANEILDIIRGETKTIFVDFHAECTSEKVAMGWYLDGFVSAVVGTHTHVMTADERILPKGTAYITDVGMTGPHDSVIGVKVEQSISRLMNQRPARFSPAENRLRFSAVLIEVDESSGKSISIERIFECDNE
ncbi:TIGR00282 family metallophosphoesterase [Candidatus Latescibacterota bacterium]